MTAPGQAGLRWRARWIWAGRPAIVAPSVVRPELSPDARDQLVLLRRSVELSDRPETAWARVTADGRYRLWVNGVAVGRGPVRGDPRRLRYDRVDLAPQLRPGANTVAAAVRFYARPVAFWQPVPPTYTLGAGAFLLDADLGDEPFVTDRRWWARHAPGWAARAPDAVDGHPVEVVDGRRWEPEWMLEAGPGDGWAPATELVPVHVGSDGRGTPPTHPFGPLLASPLGAPGGGRRQPVDRTRRTVAGGADRGDPVEQVVADERSADDPDGPVTLHHFDFGQVVAGTLELTVSAPPGTRLDAAAAESLDRDGHLALLGQHDGVRYLTGGTTATWASHDPVGLRHLRVAVRGQASVTAAVTEAHRPRPPGAAFACSDRRLDTIYAIGLRTVDLCATDAYVDCPTREQRAWTGDAVVHQMVDLTANPDWSLARHHPVLAAAPRPDGMLPMAAGGDFAAYDQSFIPDWALHWVRSVHNLYRWTGDRELVASLLPVAEGVLRWFEPFVGADGLLHDVTGWVLVDWSSLYTAGASSALAALWARGLSDFAAMAAWLGDAGRARWARRRWAGVAGGFEAFWDEERGVYVDHLVDGRPMRPAAQHGAAAGLAAGLVPAGRVGRVLDNLLDPGRLVRRSWAMDSVTPDGDSSGLAGLAFPRPEPDWDVETEMVEAQPFFRYVVHDAVARHRPDQIAGLCLDWQEFVDRGETTWPECWRGGTHCHGWSSTPTRDLAVYVLGVRPEEPGFASARVAPRLGPLEWATGTVPTPAGLVTVEATRHELTVDSPVPVVVDVGGTPVRRPAGRHRLRREGAPLEPGAGGR